MIENINECLLIENINYALKCLNDRERNIIEMRYGYSGNSEMTLNDVGKALGVTRERIRQIEAKAIMKMRQYIHKHRLFEGVYRNFTEEELYPKNRKNSK